MEIEKISIANKTQETITLTQSEADQITADATPIADTIRQNMKAELSSTDALMARVTEDLIQILIDKGTIAMSDFSTEAQAVIADREALRSDIAGE